MTLHKDVSISAVIAGFVTVLVGFTSSAVIVFQAAQALGASSAEIGSWMGALGMGMGFSEVSSTDRYRLVYPRCSHANDYSGRCSNGRGNRRIYHFRFVYDSVWLYRLV